MFFFLAFLFFAQAAFAETVELPPELSNFVQKLDSDKNKLQGGAIAILYKGQVVYKATFGNKNGNTGPITENTLFPVASVSKAISSIAVALIVEQGRLNLDEKLKLPYLKNAVSLTNILSHTTGYKFPGNMQIEQGMPRKRLLNTLQQQQPHCEPGQCYRYSNTTFSLLEEALNKKKLSLNAVIANLRNTLKTQGIQVLPMKKVDFAYPHYKETINAGEVITPLPFPPYYPKATPAAAGVFASIDGMIEVFKLSFGYRPDLISKGTLDRIFAPLQLNDDVFKWNGALEVVGFDAKNIESWYALGWRVLKIKDNPGQDMIFHSGGIKGINSFIGFIPSAEIGMIVLVNQNSSFPIKSGLGLWNAFVNWSPQP